MRDEIRVFHGKITDEEADAIRAEQVAEQPAPQEPTLAVDLVDQVLADPAALARLKAALGGASA